MPRCSTLFACRDFSLLSAPDTISAWVLVLKLEEKRKYIKTTANVLLSTGMNNNAQHGHGQLQDSGNKGNFLAIMELIVKKIKHSNAKYTSHNIQNELWEGWLIWLGKTDKTKLS